MRIGAGLHLYRYLTLTEDEEFCEIAELESSRFILHSGYTGSLIKIADFAECLFEYTTFVCLNILLSLP